LDRPTILDQLCINAIRTLSIDAVQQANSGHPGMPMWESRTPGHPERGVTPGVEVTTGPLGQGVGNSVGLAIAERWLAATFNRPGNEVVDHYTYVLASDGDLMEGVAAEAASLAGTLRLGRLIVLYDANRITLSATTNLTFTEDLGARSEAYGWHVQQIDGHDPVAVDAALRVARAVEDRPSLIVARTHIGYGSPHKQDTWHAHGEPLGVEEVRLTKQALEWPEDRSFYPSGGCATGVSNVHQARCRTGSVVATPFG
jgi:transketolase